MSYRCNHCGSSYIQKVSFVHELVNKQTLNSEVDVNKNSSYKMPAGNTLHTELVSKYPMPIMYVWWADVLKLVAWFILGLSLFTVIFNTISEFVFTLKDTTLRFAIFGVFVSPILLLIAYRFGIRKQFAKELSAYNTAWHCYQCKQTSYYE